MKSLVTGGAGFIGSHIADALIAIGHQVLVLDNLSRGKRENIPAQAELAQVDITSPEAEQVIQAFAPQAVFHLAAQMDVRHSVADPVFDARVNVEGTVRVASAAARAGAGVFVFASSGGAIYGEQDNFPATESHRLRPESPYGLSKHCGELYLDYFARSSGLRNICLRFANVYGPRQDPHGEAGVVAIFSEKMLRNEEPVIFGDGQQTRDYVCVVDVVRAALLALRHSEVSGPFNIGTGVETDVNALARHLADAIGYQGEIRHAAAKLGEQRRSVLDTRLAREKLHWEPQVPLAQGLADTARWFAGRIKK